MRIASIVQIVRLAPLFEKWDASSPFCLSKMGARSYTRHNEEALCEVYWSVGPRDYQYPFYSV